MSGRRRLHALRRHALRASARFQDLLGGEQAGFIALGGVVGVVSGLAAVGFVNLVHGLNTLVWTGRLGLTDVVPEDVLGTHGAGVADGAFGGPVLSPLVVVPLGMLLVVVLVRRLCPEAGGHGVPEVMDAVARRGGLIKGKVGWVKLLASSITIGTGGSVGKEGPIVQVGAAFGSTIGRFFGIHGRPMRTLVGCGAAAGIASIFNAPIGGVLFALEIIIGSYQVSAFAPVLVASVAGAVTSRRFLSGEPAFAVPEALREGLTLVSTWEMAAYVVLGLVFGVLSVLFTRTLYMVEDGAHRWRAPATVKALVAGLAVGALGLALPRVLGEGHHTMTAVLGGDVAGLTLGVLLALGVVKLLATVLTIAGGGSGGVFAPSLFVGAMFGGAFGQTLAWVFPGQVAGTGAYALAGMAALLAGTAHAPLTAILLLFEMSDNYLLILPLMTSSVLSAVVAQRWMSDSIYTLDLSRRGIVLRDREDTALLRRLRVGDAMRPPTDAIPETTTFDRIVRRLLQSDQHDFPVVDAEGRLTGAISLDDVREFLRDEALDHLVLARDCVRPVDTLHPTTTLLEAMEAFDHQNLYEVPVVVGDRLVGRVTRRDVLATYRQALLAAARSAEGKRKTPSPRA